MNINHGLAGGQLDPTKHVEAAITRLLKPSEIKSYRDTIMPAPVPQVPKDWRAN
jgi:hypothetical protein